MPEGDRTKPVLGFSLIEVLVVMAVLSVIAILFAGLFESTSRALINSKDRMRQFGDARVAFEYMSRNLEQATLNTYLDYRYSSTDENLPNGYAPQSELHFLTGPAKEFAGNRNQENLQTHAVFFQAPLGSSDRYEELSNLLNGRGYFVEFGHDWDYRPDFIGLSAETRHRFRLKEFRPPEKHNLIYKEKIGDAEDGTEKQLTEWFKHDSPLYTEDLPYYKVVRNIADNVIALIISPRLSEKEAEAKGLASPEDFAPDYRYDTQKENPTANKKIHTQHQLPPLLRLVLVSISEKTAVRLQQRYDDTIPPELVCKSSWFRDSRKLDEDLAQFEAQLKEANVEYRVFQTMVAMQGSKWSDESN